MQPKDESTLEAMNEATASHPNMVLNQAKLDRYVADLKSKQNLPAAIFAGAVGAFVSGLLWAVITVATEYQIGYMAIAVGFIVGFAVRLAGNGMTPVFGVIGAVFALLGCVLGNVFSLIGFAANEFDMGYLEVAAGIEFSLLQEAMIESFGFIDLLFYGIALYQGFRLGTIEIEEEDIVKHTMEPAPVETTGSFDSLAVKQDAAPRFEER